MKLWPRRGPEILPHKRTRWTRSTRTRHRFELSTCFLTSYFLQRIARVGSVVDFQSSVRSILAAAAVFHRRRFSRAHDDVIWVVIIFLPRSQTVPFLALFCRGRTNSKNSVGSKRLRGHSHGASAPYLCLERGGAHVMRLRGLFVDSRGTSEWFAGPPSSPMI